MGDLATLAKARRELEDLYMGVPDESVNLTFQDFADLKQIIEKKKQTTTTMESIQECNSPMEVRSNLNKLPSLDFNRAKQTTRVSPHNHHHHHVQENLSVDSSFHGGHRHNEGDDVPLSSRGAHRHENGDQNYRSSHVSPLSSHHSGFRHAVDSSMAFDDVSGMSMHQGNERGGRRRPGIPHSNICTICSTYIYVFRHRCLVCGRVYCRQCVSIGMGDMTEGRKCTHCLGKRFSQRYIQRAGNVGCCSSYPSMVKQQELKWAEKGPRKSGERGDGHSMVSRSRSPMTPRTPNKAYGGSNSPSFVMNSPYSPYPATTLPI